MPRVSLPVVSLDPEDPVVRAQLARGRREKDASGALQVRVEREALRLRLLAWIRQRFPGRALPHVPDVLADGVLESLDRAELAAIDRVVLDALVDALPPPAVLAPIIGVGPHYMPLPEPARALLQQAARDVLQVSRDAGVGLPGAGDPRDDLRTLTFLLEVLVRTQPGAGVGR